MSSDEEPTMGTPSDMRATCTNCGQTYRGGPVTVWLKREETPDEEHDGRITNEPKDDVSFKCVKGCQEVHPMDVEVLKYNE